MENLQQLPSMVGTIGQAKNTQLGSLHTVAATGENRVSQQLHWDFKPRGSCDTKELLGSVLVALWTTRLIIYPMSHRWDKMVSTEGANSKRKRQRQTTSSLVGRQLLPVIVEIPAGSILFFSALMHAGYGIWSLDEMLIRPVPSMDDMMRTSISDLLNRYQALLRELSNTTASNRLTLLRQSEVTTYRAKHLTSISTIAYHSHFYSHLSSLLTMSGWVKN